MMWPLTFVLAAPLATILALSPAVSLEPGIELYRRGEFRAALDAFQAASRAAPGDPEVRLWLGKTQLKVRNWDGAVAEVERAVALSPGVSRYHLWLGRALGEKASRAWKLSAFGLARRVRQEFEMAVRLDGGDLDARFDLLEFYIEAPGIVGGGSDKAAAQARDIAAQNPMRGHSARARILRAEEKWDQARAEYERGRQGFPGQPEPHLELAEYLLSRGDAAGALPCAGRALELAPSNPQARLLAAAARIRLGTALPEAERALRSLAGGPLDDADPSFAEVHYWIGQRHLAEQRVESARQALGAALRYDPDFTPARKALSGLPE